MILLVIYRKYILCIASAKVTTFVTGTVTKVHPRNDCSNEVINYLLTFIYNLHDFVVGIEM